MASLHFAQISDIHISSLGDHHDLLSGHAAGFLAKIVAELNQIDDLDFVLLSGDLFDTASAAEFEQFQAIYKDLRKPAYIIPGNHDRRDPGRQNGLTRHDFARHFNPQFEARPQAAEAQVGYWSVALNSSAQLIGLDSVVDGDWNGRIDEPQLAWLGRELARHAGKFIIVAVHHPLHKLAPIDDLPGWHKFVCDNGADLMALFDQHPQVKLVLTGHHHLGKADILKQRLHLACPAVALYPCSYRLLRLSQGPDQRSAIAWQTKPVADEATLKLARQRMRQTWISDAGFAPDFVETHIELARGSDLDQAGQIIL
jgi:3',5'-cyclic AMP phosphodiesterase CpdA